VRPFLFVFENLTRLRIHSDFVYGTAAFDVERVTETAAALLSFQFFVGDCSWPSLLSDGAGLFDTNFCPFCELFPSVRDQLTRQRGCQPDKYQTEGDGDEPPERLTGRRLLAVIEAGLIAHGSPFLFSVSTDPEAEVKWIPADTQLAALVAALNDARPTQINCFGSVLEELAAEAPSGRLKISPHRVTTNSEPLLPETRDAVRKVWGVEINNMWGCVEVGHLAIECDAHQGMHMTDDFIITEFVDDKEQPTRDPDAIDRVLVTSLFGRTLPLIRYELTDIPVPDDKPCSCGAYFPLVKGVKGRADDIFIYSGIHIHPLAFRTPLGQNPDIAEYQVHQTQDGAKIGVVATGPVDIAALRQEVVDGLAKSGLHNAQVEINLVDSLERHKETGKLKRFIPLKR
jgi:phenylacetate-coenzyme A ligase PaaK-like adenylate-forming protein